MSAPSSPLFLALLMFLVASVAATFGINSPVDGTTWQAGSTNRVTWIAQPVGSQLNATNVGMPVKLVRGNPSALQPVADLGMANEADGGVQVTVPANLTAGTDYAIQVGTTYSHAFTIVASGTPLPTASSNQTSSGGNSTNNGPSSNNGTTNNNQTSNNGTNSSSSGQLSRGMTSSVAALVPVALFALFCF